MKDKHWAVLVSLIVMIIGVAMAVFDMYPLAGFIAVCGTIFTACSLINLVDGWR